MKYDKPGDEWILPRRRGYKMLCCGCGLVHVLDFRLVGNGRKVIQFRAKRDERATAAARRGKPKRLRKALRDANA